MQNKWFTDDNKTTRFMCCGSSTASTPAGREESQEGKNEQHSCRRFGDALATALAETKDFERAIRTVGHTMELAQDDGRSQVAAQVYARWPHRQHIPANKPTPGREVC